MPSTIGYFHRYFPLSNNYYRLIETSYSYQTLSWSCPPLLHLNVRPCQTQRRILWLLFFSNVFRSFEPCRSLWSLIIAIRTFLDLTSACGYSSEFLRILTPSSSQNNGFRHVGRHNILCTISQPTARSSDSARLGKYYSTQDL